MEGFLRFALNQTQDLVLLLHKEKILFVNKCFEEAFQIEGEKIVTSQRLSFFTGEQEEKFKDKVIAVSKADASLVEEKFIVTVSKLLVGVKVTFSKYDGEYICCKWEFLSEIDQFNSELNRLRWLDIVDKHSEKSWFCFESDLKEEIRFLYHSKASEKLISAWKLGPNAFPDHLSTREISAIPNHDTEFWLSKLRTLSLDSPIGIFQNQVEIGTNNFMKIQATIEFIGISSAGLSRYISIVENITEKIDAENELNNKKKQLSEMSQKLSLLQGFFDNSPIFLGTASVVDGKIKMGISNKGNSHWFEGFTRDTTQLWISKYHEAKKTGCPTLFEFVIDGVHYSCCLVYLTHCEFAFSSQDISARIQLETTLEKSKADLEETVKMRTRELENALQVKSRFLATMSHEIRTPLAGITSILSLLGDTEMNDEQKNLLRTGQVCAEQLLVVINDILDLSKMDENKMNLENVQFTVRNLLEESMEVVSFEAEKKKIELILDISPSIQDTQMGDPSRLRQIVINLLSNAVKFSNKGEIILKAITNELFENKEKICELVISVKDEGIGIPDAARSKIFQPFTQADTSMSRRYGGSGLGLTISRRLAEMMNGHMRFESAEGKGSTFYLTIRGPWLPASLPRHSVPSPCRGKRILVIEANETMSNILLDRLSSWGFDPMLIKTRRLSNTERVPSPVHSDIVTGVPMGEADAVLVDINCGISLIESINQRKPVFVLSYLPLSPPIQDLPIIKKPIREGTLRAQLVKFFLKSNQVAMPEPVRMNKPDIVDRSNVRILIAEDNIMNQKIIHKILNTFGFANLDTVENGREAVNAVKAKYYDIVLMDCMMPELSGIEATEIIRQTIPTPAQPKAIIALTADAFSENKVQCLAAGMQEVVTKPIQHKLLRDVIEKYLK